MSSGLFDPKVSHQFALPRGLSPCECPMDRKRLRIRMLGLLLGLGFFEGRAVAAIPHDPRPAPCTRPRRSPSPGWLTLFGPLAALFTVRMAGDSQDEGQNQPSEDSAARARDEDLLRELGELVSTCPTCDRVLASDDVWYRAASWLSLRKSLPRSEQPCPACQRNTNSS